MAETSASSFAAVRPETSANAEDRKKEGYF